jgi:hypothetical protein
MSLAISEGRFAMDKTRSGDRFSSTRTLVVVSLVPVILVVLLQRRLVFDDPYIFFRYARNLAHGHGWRFNPGLNDSDAATSPLYVLLLAVATITGISTTAAASALFIVATSATAVLTGIILRRFGFEIGAVVVAALIASAPALGAVRGMEAPLYLFFVVASFVATSERRPMLTGLCFALLVLTRPDGLFFVLPIAVCALVVDRSRRLTSRQWSLVVATFSVPLLSWLIFHKIFVGHVLPGTFAAKTAQRDSGLFGGGWMFLRGAGQVWSLGHGSSVILRSFFYLLVTLALIGLVYGLFQRVGWQFFLSLVGAGTALLLFYGIIFNLPPYPWYYAPFVMILLVFAAVGIDGLLRAVQPRTVRLFLAAFVVLVLTTSGILQTPRGPSPLREDYFVMGSWLRTQTPKSATIAFYEIGAIGWVSDRRIIDSVFGLLDAAALPYVRKLDVTWWSDYYRPDYVLRVVSNIHPGEWGKPWRIGHQWYAPVHRTAQLVAYRRIALGQ